MKIIFAIIAILGYVLNINNYKLYSYITWLISNSLWALYSLYMKEYELAMMFLIYDGFCIYGITKEYKNGINLLQKCLEKKLYD